MTSLSKGASARSEVVIAKDFSSAVIWPYIDRVHVWIETDDQAAVEDLERKLALHCENIFIETVQKLGDKPYFHLSQPSQTAFQVARESDHLGNMFYAEVAIDFCTRRKADAKAIEILLLRHGVQSWRGGSTTRKYFDTTYSGPRRNRLVTAIYSTRPSKVTGMPCCHLEHRFRSHQSVEQAGLSVGALADMGTNELLEWWARKGAQRFQLFETNLNALVRSVRKIKRNRGRPRKNGDREEAMPSAKRPINYLRHPGYTLIRLAEYELDESGDTAGLDHLQRAVDAVTKAFKIPKRLYLVRLRTALATLVSIQK